MSNQVVRMSTGSTQGLNMRSSNTVSSTNLLTTIPNGSPVTVVSGPVVNGGLKWYYIDATVKGRRHSGYVVGDYLK